MHFKSVHRLQFGNTELQGTQAVLSPLGILPGKHISRHKLVRVSIFPIPDLQVRHLVKLQV